MASRDAVLYIEAVRYAILGDLHGNLEAFQAVLEDARQSGGVAELWCLGDIVGYGPDPGPCIELLRSYPRRAVAGNHDLAAIGRLGTGDFNPEAAAAALWTARQLTEEHVAYLEGLPRSLVVGDFTLVHGSPREPVWEYVLSASTAQESLDFFATRYCLVGHSHVPFYFEQGTPHLQPLGRLVLGSKRLIINPGGVGQPRDGDPKASYAIYDSETRVLEHRRAPYDIQLTQHKMLRAGLPSLLAARLAYGR